MHNMHKTDGNCFIITERTLFLNRVWLKIDGLGLLRLVQEARRRWVRGEDCLDWVGLGAVCSGLKKGECVGPVA